MDPVCGGALLAGCEVPFGASTHAEVTLNLGEWDHQVDVAVVGMEAQLERMRVHIVDLQKAGEVVARAVQAHTEKWKLFEPVERRGLDLAQQHEQLHTQVLASGDKLGVERLAAVERVVQENLQTQECHVRRISDLERGFCEAVEKGTQLGADVQRVGGSVEALHDKVGQLDAAIANSSCVEQRCPQQSRPGTSKQGWKQAHAR